MGRASISWVQMIGPKKPNSLESVHHERGEISDSDGTLGDQRSSVGEESDQAEVAGEASASVKES